MGMAEKILSRRDFLKMAGAGLGAAAFGPVLPKGDILPKSEVESANKVFFDKNGVMFVNGSRFLPKVLYGLPGEHSKPESWEKAKAAGANIVTMVFPTAENVALAEQTGMKILARLDYAFPDFIPNQAEFERLEKSKAVIGWEVDEPNQYWGKALFELTDWLGGRTKLPLRVTTDGRARLMRNSDSVRFLKILSGSFGGAVISGPDVYEPLARVADEVADYSGRRKELSTASVWQVTGAFSEGNSLTYDQMMYQTISGIVAGSRGVGFYDSPWNCDRAGCRAGLIGNGKINAFGKHLADVKRIFDLMEKLKHGLTGIEIRSGTRGAINFRIMRHWTFANRQFLLCCNNNFGAADSPTCGEIEGLSPETSYVDVITGRETMSDRRGKLSVSLKPGEAAVFM